MLSGNYLFVCCDKLVFRENISPEKTSLHQLSNEQSLSGGHGYKRCIYKCEDTCIKQTFQYETESEDVLFIRACNLK